MSRPYTGTKDAVARGARPGTKQFQALMAFLFQMRSLGIFANRPVRGGSSLSVHATGRACDLGGKPEQVRAAIEAPESTDVQGLLSLVRASGALDYTRQAAEREAEMAQAALQPLADSVFKSHLIDLASFVVTRRH